VAAPSARNRAKAHGRAPPPHTPFQRVIIDGCREGSYALARGAQRAVDADQIIGNDAEPLPGGRGVPVSVASILTTLRDMMKVRRTVFSPKCDRP
jgi:hypothetical protein